MKVTFVQTAERRWTDTQMFGVNYMPVWAYTLASHLEGIPDLSLELYDERVHPGRLPESDVYFFTGINQDLAAIQGLRRAARAACPQATLVLGGPICWSYQMAGRLSDLDGFDYLVVGDGEELAVDLVKRLIADQPPKPGVIEAPRRFPMSMAQPMSRKLMDRTVHDYYGAVIEVSRGCPFLCEFCDIRTLPDNNRAHNAPASLIVEELEYFRTRGVRQVLFACDNFIGTPAWAEEVCDEIIAWRERTGADVSIYTWLTINLARHPGLLQKLRRAGFDMFFIGVESFHNNSLLETAKVQNTKLGLPEALRTIQSYGFIVVAGLIFGFDTDPDDVVDMTLAGIVDSGLISGDPTLLTALPGTPLYQRMKLSGRLRTAKLGLGGFKYQTNIRYLKPREVMVSDYMRFVRRFNTPATQLQRLRNFLACLETGNYSTTKRGSYIRPWSLLRLTLRRPRYMGLLLKRVAILLRNPKRIAAIASGAARTAAVAARRKGVWPYFWFWMFIWSNALMKYGGLRETDFDIDWVGESFDRHALVPEEYRSGLAEPIPLSKTRAQRRLTIAALEG